MTRRGRGGAGRRGRGRGRGQTLQRRQHQVVQLLALRQELQLGVAEDGVVREAALQLGDVGVLAELRKVVAQLGARQGGDGAARVGEM